MLNQLATSYSEAYRTPKKFSQQRNLHLTCLGNCLFGHSIPGRGWGCTNARLYMNSLPDDHRNTLCPNPFRDLARRTWHVSGLESIGSIPSVTGFEEAYQANQNSARKSTSSGAREDADLSILGANVQDTLSDAGRGDGRGTGRQQKCLRERQRRAPRGAWSDHNRDPGELDA